MRWPTGLDSLRARAPSLAETIITRANPSAGAQLSRYTSNPALRSFPPSIPIDIREDTSSEIKARALVIDREMKRRGRGEVSIRVARGTFVSIIFPSSRKSLTTEFLPLINTFHAIGGGGARKVGRNAQRWCYTFRKLNLPPDKFVGNFSPAHSRL